MKRNIQTLGVVRSPEVKEIAPGRPVMRFALVEMNPEGGSTWHSCVAWGGTASKMSRITDGDIVEVQAKSVTRSYSTSTGAKRIVTEWVVQEFKIKTK